MPKTAIMLFSFIAGALLADVTHPAGQRFWTDDFTDTGVGCVDDCLEPEMPPAKPMTMECSPSRDQTFLRCEVV